MKLQSVQVTLTADDLRVMASALRLLHRTTAMSAGDQQVVRRLVHLAERSEDGGGRCYAEVMQQDAAPQLTRPTGWWEDHP